MRLFIFSSLILSTGLLAETALDDPMKKAEEYYDAALFDLAIPAYKQVLLESEDSAERSAATLRLAQAYYLNQQYQQTIDLLQGQNQPLLLGKAHNRIGDYDQAIASLKDTQDNFELGFAYFMKQDYSRAKPLFNAASENPLARIYLARIELAQNNYHAAHQILADLETSLSAEDPLLYETAYYKGNVYYQLKDYAKAVESFQKALPKYNPEKADWYEAALYQLGNSYLKMGDLESREVYFAKAEQIFKKLIQLSGEERDYLALGELYLAKGKRLKDEEALQEVEKLLSKPEILTSKDGQTHALLLRAQAVKSYAERDNLYRRLTLESNQESSYFATGWYMRGLNDFEEGEALLGQQQTEDANRAFERAASSFKKAFELMLPNDKGQAALALKYQAQALAQQNNSQSMLQALFVLDALLHQYRDLLLEMKDPDEVFYLHALIAARLSKDEEKYGVLAETSLKEGIAQYPNGKHVDLMLHVLGHHYYQQKKYAEAASVFRQLEQDYSNSKLAGEALFWVAHCEEQRGASSVVIKQLRQRVFEQYPQSKYAPEAFFLYYSYREYLQGERTAIKHLRNFIEKFPDSPFVLNAHYLIGLDYKRDRKTAEGKWIRKKNLTAAIDAFQAVETAFEELGRKSLLPREDLEYLVRIRYRASLERALANLNIAEESQSAKRQIYLDYAREVFKQIASEFEDKQNPYAEMLKNKEPYPAIEEESTYWLAQTYVKLGQEEEAKKVLEAMLDKYQGAKVTRGYYLSRVWYELGMLAAAKNDFASALDLYSKAEDASKGRVLTSEQRLDLWIQQSFCCQALEQLDHAILILSKVINDDSISGLRLKAMYLRAELYEKQGRPELARRQLEATSKKGGEWAMKAKEKLEKEYAY